MSTRQERGWARYLGPLIGYTSWTFALAITCAMGGRPEWIYELCLPGLLVSLALAIATFTSLEFVSQVFPDDARLARQCLMGRVLTDVGILLLLCTTWILPVLEQDETIMGLPFTDLKTSALVPDEIGMVCLAGGIVLTLLSARRVIGEQRP